MDPVLTCSGPRGARAPVHTLAFRVRYVVEPHFTAPVCFDKREEKAKPDSALRLIAVYWSSLRHGFVALFARHITSPKPPEKNGLLAALLALPESYAGSFVSGAGAPAGRGEAVRRRPERWASVAETRQERRGVRLRGPAVPAGVGRALRSRLAHLLRARRGGGSGLRCPALLRVPPGLLRETRRTRACLVCSHDHGAQTAAERGSPQEDVGARWEAGN
jgi:hypothetical protein